MDLKALVAAESPDLSAILRIVFTGVALHALVSADTRPKQDQEIPPFYARLAREIADATVKELESA